MPGKLKAALAGGVVGLIVVLVIELLAVIINDEVFFGSERSWMILVLAVVVFGWGQMRAYDRKQGQVANPAKDPDHRGPTTS